jgi:hypothetical protein
MITAVVTTSSSSRFGSAVINQTGDKGVGEDVAK